MRPGTKPSMRSRRACAAPPSRSRRASSIRCWAQWLAAHRASMTRTVGTPHEIEPNTVLGVDSAFGVGELRVAHVCVQCVADQFPHALVWEPCAAERLVGVFCGRLRRQQRHLDLWLRCLPAGLLARERNTRQEQTNRSSQPMVPSEPVGPTESIPPTPRGVREHLGHPPAHRRSSPRAPPPRDQPREPPPSAFITSCGSSLIASSCPTVTTQLPHSYYTVTTQLPHSYYMRNLMRKRDSC